MVKIELYAVLIFPMATEPASATIETVSDKRRRMHLRNFMELGRNCVICCKEIISDGIIEFLGIPFKLSQLEYLP